MIAIDFVGTCPVTKEKTCFARRELKNKHRKRVVHDLKIWLLLISPHCYITTRFKIYGQTALLQSTITQHRGKNGELEQAIHMSQLIYSCLSSFGYFVYFMFSLFFFKFKFYHNRKTQLAYPVGRHHLPRPITRKEWEWEGEWEDYEIGKKNCRNERYNHIGICFVVLFGFGYFI